MEILYEECGFTALVPPSIKVPIRAVWACACDASAWRRGLLRRCRLPGVAFPRAAFRRHRCNTAIPSAAPRRRAGDWLSVFSNVGEGDAGELVVGRPAVAPGGVGVRDDFLGAEDARPHGEVQGVGREHEEGGEDGDEAHPEGHEEDEPGRAEHAAGSQHQERREGVEAHDDQDCPQIQVALYGGRLDEDVEVLGVDGQEEENGHVGRRDLQSREGHGDAPDGRRPETDGVELHLPEGPHGGVVNADGVENRRGGPQRARSRRAARVPRGRGTLP